MSETSTTVLPGPDEASTEPAGSAGGRRVRLRVPGLDRFSGIYVWAIVVIAFSFARPDTFPTLDTFQNIVATQAVTGLLTLGLMLALAAGVFDLSVAGTMTMSVILVAWLQTAGGMLPIAAIVVTLVAGVVIGLVNALLIVKLSVPSLIATLGMGGVLSALSYALADGQSIVAGIPYSFLALGRTQILGVPVTVIYLAVLAIVLLVILEHTPLGRRLYATGGNEVAARLTGVRTARAQVAVLVACSLIATIAGIVYTARLGSASLDAGAPYLLPAFAAVFLGSTQILPGHFNVRGTLVAIFLIATGVKGLSLIWSNIPWVQPLFEGAALVLAVAISAQASKRRTGAGVVMLPRQD